MVTVNPIRTEDDLEASLREIEALMGAVPGTPEGDRLDVLVTLVQAFEQAHHAIEAPDPIALIEFAMDQQGLSRRDLEVYIGPSGRISEILNRRRPLTLDMIRRLTQGLGLPAEILVREYPLADEAA